MHIKFLEKNYEEKKFICSGRKNPRDGGIILCRAKDKKEVHSIIIEDTFYKNEIADYNVVEFIPSKYDMDFKIFVD